MDQLKFAVIHELVKERGATVARVNLREGLLDTSKPLVLHLASLLAGLLGRDQGAVYWGQFGDRRREGQFPGATATFSRELTEEQFVALTHTAMEELAALSAEESFATGGFIFFAAYTVRDVDYLLVAMIKERDGIALSEDFEPEEINEVDLSKLHQAARVNLHSYLATITNREEEASDERDGDEEADESARERTYLCFINRKGRDDVAGYFIKALGCEKGVSSARATKGVIKAVRAYVRKTEAIAPYAPRARQALIDYLDSLGDGSTVALDHVVQVVARELPIEQVVHLEGLKAFLNEEDNQIPEDFQVNKRALQAYARIAARTDHWNLNFEINALGIRDAEIIYDHQRRSLTLTQIPVPMIKKIEDTLRDRGQLDGVE